MDTHDDGLVACTDNTRLIRRYYFPVGSTKSIPYAEIYSIERALGIRLRVWGSSTFLD